MAAAVLVALVLTTGERRSAPEGAPEPRPEPSATARGGPPSAPPCTRYAAPDGGEDGSGRRRSEPLSLLEASRQADPGDVVCLLGGDYVLSGPLYIERSGEEGRPIVYRSEDRTARIRWSGDDRNDMFQVTRDTHHIEIWDLDFDGNNVADMAVKCSRGAHHVRVVGNRIRNTGVAGVTGKYCDYLTVDRNLIHRAGYNKGWGSGVSLNLHVWSDREPGFHSVVTNNVISGTVDESEHESDGNGIIVDLGDDTPPALIAGNVVYENGGRCIHAYHVSRVWIVNNTCYRNTLDTRLGGEGGGVGEFTSYDAQDVHLINNVAYSWNESQPAYKVEEGSEVAMHHNVEYGGPVSVVPGEVYDDTEQLRRADPLFVDAPDVHPTEERQFEDAAEPVASAERFGVRDGSPLIDAGIDPRTVDGVTPALREGLDEFLRFTVDGTPRPQGDGWDIGAYER